MKKLFILLLPVLFLVSCAQKEPENAYKVEVKTADFAFLAPVNIPSGWITFVLNNVNAKHVHELMEKAGGRLMEMCPGMFCPWSAASIINYVFHYSKTN